MSQWLSEKLNLYTTLPRSVLILCVGSFINRAGSFVVPFMTLYTTKELGYSKQFGGWCFGVFGVGSILAAIIGGQLADRIGRKPVMMFALCGASLILLVLSSVTSQWALLACIFVFALVADMYRPAASAMMGDLVSTENRPAAFGLMYVSFNLGFGVAAVVGGFLAEYSFRLLFYGDAITTGSYGLIISFLIYETLPSKIKPSSAAEPCEIREETADDHTALMMEPNASEWNTALRRMAGDTTFLLFSLATLLTSLVFMQGFSTLPMQMADMGITERWTGLLLSVNGWIIVFLQLPMTACLTRFHRVLVILAGEILIAIGFGLTTFASTIPFFALTIAVWTIGEVVQATFKQSLVADLAPADMRARYMGVFSLCHAVGITVGIPAGSRILQDYGPRTLWPICFVLVLVASTIYGLVYMRVKVSDRLVAKAALASSAAK